MLRFSLLIHIFLLILEKGFSLSLLNVMLALGLSRGVPFFSYIFWFFIINE